MPRSAILLLLTPALACAGGSSHWEAVPAPASALPERFVQLSGAAVAGPACLVHLRDPRDGSTITLLQSVARAGAGSLGDYAPELPARYGLGPREALRVDCGTGAPLGRVPR